MRALTEKPQPGVRTAISPIPGFEYSWLPSAATIENRTNRRPDPISHILFHARGLMAKAQSRHSVWDESIESHAGQELVVV